MTERKSPPDHRPPIPLLAMNGAVAALPHDPGVLAAMDLLCRGSPIIRTGSACDLACTYCCVGDDGPPLQREESLRALVDGLAAVGLHGIGYMGGEPTVHPSFLALVRHARVRGVETQMLCTNGVKMGDAAFAAEVLEAGVNAVTTSLDAFDPNVQVPLYGGKPVHGRALAGLHHVLAAPGVEVLLSAVVTAANASLLAGYMQEVARLQDRHGKPIGVMMCVLQRPARGGDAQHTLAIGLLDAATLVRKALASAREVGVAAFTFGFPPCLLEGHSQHVSELYASEWTVSLETGTVERSRLGDAKTYWASCASCRHAWYCPGVMKQYADAGVQAAVVASGGVLRQ